MTDKCTWMTKAPPKCRFFIWLMLQNRLWTAARLQIRGSPNDYFCPLCIRNLETSSHLFQESCFSREIWDRVSLWITATTMRPGNWRQVNDLGLWFLELANNATRAKLEGVRSIVMLTTWEIWKKETIEFSAGMVDLRTRCFVQSKMRPKCGLEWETNA